MSGAVKEVPTAIASGLIGALLGAGATLGIMWALGGGDPQHEEIARLQRELANLRDDRSGPTGGTPGNLFDLRKAVAEREKSGKRGKAQPAESEDRPTNQLAALVIKLDPLTGKGLAIRLSDEQRARVQEQLKNIAQTDVLSDTDAKKRLVALLEILKDQKETLEAAGYHWPDPNANDQSAAAPNPFKQGEAAKHLRSLEEHLDRSR